MTIIDLTQPEYIQSYNDIKNKYFTYNGYQNIIISMINNKMNNTNEYFEYFKQYIESLTEYEISKIIFQDKIKELNPNIDFNNWEILFHKNIVQLT